jgi:hypothetical protein
MDIVESFLDLPFEDGVEAAFSVPCLSSWRSATSLSLRVFGNEEELVAG